MSSIDIWEEQLISLPGPSHWPIRDNLPAHSNYCSWRAYCKPSWPVTTYKFRSALCRVRSCKLRVNSWKYNIYVIQMELPSLLRRATSFRIGVIFMVIISIITCHPDIQKIKYYHIHTSRDTPLERLLRSTVRLVMPTSLPLNPPQKNTHDLIAQHGEKVYLRQSYWPTSCWMNHLGQRLWSANLDPLCNNEGIRIIVEWF